MLQRCFSYKIICIKKTTSPSPPMKHLFTLDVCCDKVYNYSVLSYRYKYRNKHIKHEVKVLSCIAKHSSSCPFGTLIFSVIISVTLMISCFSYSGEKNQTFCSLKLWNTFQFALQVGCSNGNTSVLEPTVSCLRMSFFLSSSQRNPHCDL